MSTETAGRFVMGGAADDQGPVQNKEGLNMDLFRRRAQFDCNNIGINNL